MTGGARLARLLIALLLVAVGVPSAKAKLSAFSESYATLDPLLQQRALLSTGRSPVIVTAVDDSSLASVGSAIQLLGGTLGRALPILNALVADVPNSSLPTLATNTSIAHISLDRLVLGAMERTSATVGATAVRQSLGYDGSGIGMAVIDSGVTSWHDDLSRPGGGQRVERFVNFVDERASAHDDYGHGTHVAGIIAGNGYDSSGMREGIAPGAHLIVLKVLNGSGRGRISDVIAALDYAVAHRYELNIRVVNLSIATGVYESYNTDPLTLAARRAVMAGLVVVAASGNNGRGADGRIRYGGITAPGNAPWVLTVGASSHMGTLDRADDTIAPFSSRGPTAIDRAAKPDIVAPGVGIESLSDPNSSIYAARPDALLQGTVPTSYLPYLSLTGSSMATPVAAGTVALMLQANPSLTPNAVKAILQYTAEARQEYDPLTQGAGFLNAKGAVELARFFTAPSASSPDATGWGARIIWGNRLARGGRLMPAANAWLHDLPWGLEFTSAGQYVEWGVTCSDAACETEVPWSGLDGAARNVVWGTICGGTDCGGPWTLEAVSGADDGDGNTVVWGTGEDGNTVLWGTADDGDKVVWGTDEGDTVVWGTEEGDTVVWGTSDDEGDTVVWGTSCTDPSCEPMTWPHD